MFCCKTIDKVNIHVNRDLKNGHEMRYPLFHYLMKNANYSHKKENKNSSIHNLAQLREFYKKI